MPESQPSMIQTSKSLPSTSPSSMRRDRGIAWVLFLTCSLAFTTACVTDPYTGERRISKTFLGGLFGAGLGAGVAAGIAALAGKDAAKAALIGGGSGFIAGAAVGGYMDYQDAKLRKFLENTGVRVVRVGNEITLSMPSNITFQSDSDVLSPDFLEIMHSVTLVLKEYDKTIIEVMGHTDSSGADEYNLSLSRKRARSVGTQLSSKGVNPARVLTEGFGEQYPIAPNTTAEGRALNRRVELRLSPITHPTTPS